MNIAEFAARAAKRGISLSLRPLPHGLVGFTIQREDGCGLSRMFSVEDCEAHGGGPVGMQIDHAIMEVERF